MNVCPVVVGRERQLDALDDALTGDGGLVLVAGEAGIGKSRLLREFASRATEQGHPIVWGRPETVSAPGPYSLVVDLLEDLGAALPSGAREAQDLAASLSSQSAGGEPPARHIAARVRALLGRLGKSPVVMLEDLHLSDELSHAVLAHLARSAPEDGVLLVATYRPEEAAGESFARLLDLLQRDRIARTIELGPLDESGLVAMLEAMWGGAPNEREVEAIARLGEGVPFFIEELAGSRADDSSIPATIARAVAGRLARVAEQDRAVLRAASLMAGALDPSVLAAASGVAEAAVPGALIAGVSAGLLSDQNGRLVFRHALVREALASAIVSVERAALHGRIAEAIERVHADSLEQHASELARHHAQAGDDRAAARAWIIAGRRALKASAIEEAATAFASAREHGDAATRLDAREGEAEVAGRMGDLDRAIALFDEVAAAFEADGQAERAAGALTSSARLRSALGDVGAHATLAHALTVVGEGAPPEVRASLLIERGYTYARGFGDTESAAPLLAAGAQLADEIQDVSLRARAFQALAWVAEMGGDAAEAQRLGALSCDLARGSADGRLIAQTALDHAAISTIHGACEDALRRLDEAREHFQLGSLAAADHMRAWVLWRMGRPAEAERYAARLEMTRFEREYARIVRAWALIERGEIATANAIMDSWWASIGDEAFRAAARRDPMAIPEPSAEPALALLGDIVVAVASGRVDRGVVDTAERYADMCRAAEGDVASLTALLHAQALLAAEDLGGAESVLDEIGERVRPYPLHAARWHEARVEIARSKGDLDEAGSNAAQAVSLYLAAANDSDRARATRSLATVKAGRGDREAGVKLLREALELATSAGATAEAARIEASLRDLGARPRSGRPKGSGTKAGTLSAREEEVVALLAGGATNAEIAARLFLSPRTVEVHVKNAQKRLGVAGRPALVAWAVRHGLI